MRQAAPKALLRTSEDAPTFTIQTPCRAAWRTHVVAVAKWRHLHALTQRVCAIHPSGGASGHAIHEYVRVPGKGV